MKNLKAFLLSNKQKNLRVASSVFVVALFGLLSLFLLQPSATMQDRNQELKEKAERMATEVTSKPTFDILRPQAPAITQMLPGTLAATDPTFNRSLSFAQGGTCTLSGAGTAVHYRALPFTLSCTRDRKSTRLNSSHSDLSRMPSSA